MVKIKIKPATSNPLGSQSKPLATQKTDGKQAPSFIPQRKERRKGIIAKMVDIILDDIHHKVHGDVLESDESWNDWREAL